MLAQHLCVGKQGKALHLHTEAAALIPQLFPVGGLCVGGLAVEHIRGVDVALDEGDALLGSRSAELVVQALAGLGDVALKAAVVRPGVQFVERLYGLLEVHSNRQGETRAAGKAILDALGVRQQDCLKPQIVSSQIIRNIDAHQAQLINRTRRGQLILAGQTLYVLEVQPAAYAALAANEAEKAALINILQVQAVGSFGRLYLGGEERDIMAASRAALTTMENVIGRQQLIGDRKE